MKINVLTQSKNEIKIDLEGAGHTLCNLLQKKLLEDKNVAFAGYNIPHPLFEKAIIYVRMKGTSKPKVALVKATNKAIKLNCEFKNKLDKALES